MDSAIAERAQQANRVTWIGFGVNLALVAGKLAAGVLGHSAAMVADSVHSLSDLGADAVVLLGFRFATRPIDATHDYGHGKYETLATTVIGLALILVGLGILYGGAIGIARFAAGAPLRAPGYVALAAALVSIAAKEWLYRFTVRTGRAIQSQAVLANAWHHRSDAFSSVGTMIGIGGAILLGPTWRVLDPVAAVIVSLVIVRVGFDITRGGLRELSEASLDDETEAEILQCILATEGAAGVHGLRTRRVGNTLAIEFHLLVDGRRSVAEGHEVASRAEGALRTRYGQDTLISVHVEPADV